LNKHLIFLFVNSPNEAPLVFLATLYTYRREWENASALNHESDNQFSLFGVILVIMASLIISSRHRAVMNILVFLYTSSLLFYPFPLAAAASSTTTTTSVSPSSSPSSSDLSSAFAAAQVQNGNQPLANAFSVLSESSNSDALSEAITDFIDAISWLISVFTWLFDPELTYSYGNSPPVYPSRRCILSIYYILSYRHVSFSC
jgi:hypothetical protein